MGPSLARILGYAREVRASPEVEGVEGMAFHGWRAEALEFFDGLEADNSKAYWQRNKDVYDEQVRGPLEALPSSWSPSGARAGSFGPIATSGSAPTSPPTRPASRPWSARDTCS